MGPARYKKDGVLVSVDTLMPPGPSFGLIVRQSSHIGSTTGLTALSARIHPGSSPCEINQSIKHKIKLNYNIVHFTSISIQTV